MSAIFWLLRLLSLAYNTVLLWEKKYLHISMYQNIHYGFNESMHHDKPNTHYSQSSHECDGILNQWQLDCLFNRLSSLITKEKLKLCITGFFVRGIPWWTVYNAWYLALGITQLCAVHVPFSLHCRNVMCPSMWKRKKKDIFWCFWNLNVLKD